MGCQQYGWLGLGLCRDECSPTGSGLHSNDRIVGGSLETITGFR